MSTLFWFSYGALWLVTAAALLGVLALFNHFGAMYSVSPQGRRSQGPAEGSHVKSAEGRDILGRPVPIPVDSPSVLLFVSTDCTACAGLRPALDTPAAAVDPSRFVVICNGREDMVREWARNLPREVRVLADPRNKLGIKYEIDVVPFGIAVTRAGLVAAKGIVNDGIGLSDLLMAASGFTLADGGSEGSVSTERK